MNSSDEVFPKAMEGSEKTPRRRLFLDQVVIRCVSCFLIQFTVQALLLKMHLLVSCHFIEYIICFVDEFVSCTPGWTFFRKLKAIENSSSRSHTFVNELPNYKLDKKYFIPTGNGYVIQNTSVCSHLTALAGQLLLPSNRTSVGLLRKIDQGTLPQTNTQKFQHRSRGGVKVFKKSNGYPLI